jgi:hypothetical protein
MILAAGLIALVVLAAISEIVLAPRGPLGR